MRFSLSFLGFRSAKGLSSFVFAITRKLQSALNNTSCPIESLWLESVMSSMRNEHGFVTFHDESKTLPLKLLSKRRVSPDSFVFRFQLPSKEHVPGLLPHQHVKIHADIAGEHVWRKMTPITDDTVRGHMDLLIKIYYKTEHYPNGGLMSQYVDGLQVGDDLHMSGPVWKLAYVGDGRFMGKKAKHIKDRRFKNIVMIAGGSGITPMLQIIRHSLRHDPAEIMLWLLFANRTPDDILLKDEIDQMAKQNPRLHVWYTVNQAYDDNWPYSTGYINTEMIKVHLPTPSDDTLVLVIGPKPMKTSACFPALESLGFHQDLIL